VEILGAEKTRARLPYVDLAESIREAALKRRTGEIQAPARMSLSLAEGEDRGTVVFKSVGHALWDLAAAQTAFGG
jgi:ornithine cyclodeaminase/alanine dehydrogenase-like protein (mu-crystallin family)